MSDAPLEVAAFRDPEDPRGYEPVPQLRPRVKAPRPGIRDFLRRNAAELSCRWDHTRDAYRGIPMRQETLKLRILSGVSS